LADAKLVFVLESEHGADSPVAYIQATEQFAVPCSNGVFGTAGLPCLGRGRRFEPSRIGNSKSPLFSVDTARLLNDRRPYFGGRCCARDADLDGRREHAFPFAPQHGAGAVKPDLEVGFGDAQLASGGLGI
jgi:hypothetical protein